MQKPTTLLLLLILLVSLAFAETEIRACTQREAELNVAKETCDKTRAMELSARKERDIQESYYTKAQRDYDFAEAEWQVAAKEEIAAKTAHLTDVDILNVARQTEEQLCNGLVRNVANGTPCAKLLNDAREKNRLVLCRDAKKNLDTITTKEFHSRAVHTKKLTIVNQKMATKIALSRLREEAFERFKTAKGVWTLREATSSTACTRYNDLKIIFHGKKNPRDCRPASECSKFSVKCGEEKTSKVCKTYVQECASAIRNGVCTNWRTTDKCQIWDSFKHCNAFKMVCKSHVDKEICIRDYEPPKVQGPSSCPTGMQLAFKKEGKVVIRSCKKQEANTKRELVCQSTYDPLVYTFKQQQFDMTSEGDYELYASADGSVEVHNRQTLLPNGPVTVNSKLAILINGVDHVSYDCKTQVFQINGQQYKGGQVYNFPNGGSFQGVDYTSSNFFAPNGDRIFVRRNGQDKACWINTYVFSKNSDIGGGGLCFTQSSKANDFRIAGLFKHFEGPQDTTEAIAGAQQDILKNESPTMRAAARSACALNGMPDRVRQQCETDWLLATDATRGIIIRGYSQMILDGRV